MTKTILIVDDAKFLRVKLNNLMEKHGYKVVGLAENGHEALELYRQHKPDLVTMDINMPDMGGIEVTRKIKAFDPSAKIIMLTAMGQESLVKEAVYAGAKDFVVKPFQDDYLIEKIKFILG